MFGFIKVVGIEFEIFREKRVCIEVCIYFVFYCYNIYGFINFLMCKVCYNFILYNWELVILLFKEVMWLFYICSI